MELPPPPPGQCSAYKVSGEHGVHGHPLCVLLLSEIASPLQLFVPDEGIDHGSERSGQ